MARALVVHVRISATALTLLFAATGCASFSSGTAIPRPESVDGESRRTRSDAAESMTGAALDQVRAQRIEELLHRFAGVHVSRTPEGDFSVRIRGAQSFTGSGEPLYVVDGVQIRGQSLRNALGAVLPRDIARIEVLKDAAAAAAYGSMGGNGVILVTTRRRIADPE